MTQMGIFGLDKGDDLGYTYGMPKNRKYFDIGSVYDPNVTDTDTYGPYTSDPTKIAKIREALQPFERFWVVSNFYFLDGTAYKQGDLYKEIIEGTGGNPPNESP